MSRKLQEINAMKTETGELDLGIMPKKEEKGCAPCSPCCPPEDKPRYPELCFRGAHADLFRSKYGNCAPGDEYEATFKLRVKSSSDGENDYDKRIEFDVIAIVGDVVEEEAAETEGTETKPAKPRRMATAKKTETASY